MPISSVNVQHFTNNQTKRDKLTASVVTDRPVPEAGGCDSSLHQTLYHGCEAGPAEL